MKKTFLALLIACSAASVHAQSDSYKMLRRHFADSPEVRSYRLNGLMCRVIVKILENDDETLAAALDDVRHVRFMTIPREAFTAQGLTVGGFKSRLPKDGFEVIADITNDGSTLAFFHRQEERHKNCYFVIIEDEGEVVAIEMKGNIDPAIFASETALSSL